MGKLSPIDMSNNNANVPASLADRNYFIKDKCSITLVFNVELISAASGALIGSSMKEKLGIEKIYHSWGHCQTNKTQYAECVSVDINNDALWVAFHAEMPAGTIVYGSITFGYR